MRASVRAIIGFATILVAAAVHRLNGQSAPTKPLPLVASVTQHSDVEVVDISTGRTRIIYRRSERFSKDVSVSPDGRYVAVVQIDPGIEGGVSVRLWQPVGLLFLDTSGSIIRSIPVGMVRYTWCGPTCVFYLRGSYAENDLGFYVTGAGLLNVATGVVESLPGPPWPHALAYTAFDSSVNLVYSGAAGEPEIRRFDLTSHRVAATSHKGLSFSENGRFYLSYSDSPGQRPRVYDSQTDAELNLPDMDRVGVAERWLPSGGAHLLIRRVSPARPPAPPRANTRTVVPLRATGPVEVDYIVYDVDSRRAVRDIRGLFPNWGSPPGVVPFVSGGRVNAIVRP